MALWCIEALLRPLAVRRPSAMKLLSFSAVALVTLSLAVPSTGKTSCGQAKAELRQAQKALAAAIRDLDKAAAELHACAKHNGGETKACPDERRAFNAAAAEKRRAQDAYNFAAGQKREACGR